MTRKILFVCLYILIAAGLFACGSSNDNKPIANAGTDQNVVTGTVVTLDGSNSDGAGELLVYTWAFVAIPPGSNAQISDATVVRPTFSADVDGMYVLQLVVNASDAATVSVTAATANSAPAAAAGPDQSIATGSLVTLDGSASSDANNDPLGYSWSFVSRPPLSNADLSAATVVEPTFTADIDGDYVLQLIVSDGALDSVAATVSVTAATANSVPVANAGLDQSIVTSSLVTLDGSASSDADNDPLGYSWTFVSVPGGSALTQLTNAATTSPRFTPDVLGAYVIKLIVNDSSADSPGDNVTIIAASLFVAGAWSTTPTLVDDSTGGKASSQVAINEAGDMVAVWVVHDSLNSVYGSHYNGVTGVWSSPVLVEANDLVSASGLKLAIDATGNAVAVWTMRSSYSGPNSLYANRFDAGTGQWGTALELDTTVEDASDPEVGMDSAGNATVVWLETLPSGNQAVMSRRFDNSTPGWGAVVVLTDSTVVNQSRLCLAVDGAGYAVAIWLQEIEKTLVARRYSPTTGWGGPAVPFVSNLPRDITDQQLAFDALGNIVVVWRLYDGAADNLYADYFDAGTGTWDGATPLENLTTTVEDSQVAMDGNGNAFAIWTHYISLDRDVYVSRYDVLTGWGAAEKIDSDTANASEVAIAMDNSGNALGQWISGAPVVNRYNAATSTWSGTERLAPDGSLSSLAANSSGQAVLAWINGVLDSSGNYITKLYVSLLR